MLKAQDLSAFKTAGSTRIIDPTTNKVLLNIPYANSAKITLSGDTTSAKAQGEDCVTFPNASTLTLEYGVQLLNLDLLSFVFGSEVGEATRELSKREVFTLTSNNEIVELKGTPYANKIQAMVVADDYEYSTHIMELEEASYDSDTKRVTLTGAKKGDIVAIYYYESTLCRGTTVRAIPKKQANYRVDSLFSNKSSDDAGTESFINLIAKKCTVANNLDITFDATDVSDFTISLTASKSADGSLCDVYEIGGHVEEVEAFPSPITNLDATIVGTNAVLTFDNTKGATSVIVKYSDDDKATWKDVATNGSSSKISIPTPLDENSKKVIISNLSSGSTYAFKIIVTVDSTELESNIIDSLVVA